MLLAAVLAAYWPVFHAGFIWDDDTFLTANPLIKSADGLKSFWFTTRAADYWPVTSSTLWLEWRLWGLHAAGYHATNLAIHLADSVLLWAILHRLRVPGAFLAALLFAVHPVNVESVAWITQRKNVLALFFYLASIWFEVERDLRARLPALSPAPPWRPYYLLSILAFVLAILSKASVVILPLVLVGLICWRRRFTLKDALRLAPYFLIAAIFAAVNLWFQGRHPAGPIRAAGGLERLLGAATIVWFYLGKAVAPLRLMFFYPQWQIRAGNVLWWLPLIGALGTTGLFWRYRAGWSRPWLFAWGYFCVALIPVMGFADIYFMQFSLVADHYQHLAIIGVVTLAAFGWARWSGAFPHSRIPFIAAGLVVLGFMALSWNQGFGYRDLETRYRTAIASNPNAWLAENNLGLYLDQQGKPADALVHVQRALAINPGCAEAENNLGLFRAEAGDLAGAAEHYERAIRLRPAYAEARNNLGNVWRRAGKLPEAIGQYEAALRFEPGQAGMHYNLARALADAGRTDEAVQQLQAALAIEPNDASANYLLGLVRARQGNFVEGVGLFERALRARPDDAQAHANLGVALAQLSRYDEALAQLEIAARLAPGDLNIRDNLALLRARHP